MTYVVAITRRSDTAEAAVTALAPVLGATAYDLRLALNGPVPIVLHRNCDAQTATPLVTMLRQHGFGAVACERERIPTAEQMTVPRTFEFGAEAIALDDGAGARRLPYAAVLAVIRAAIVGDATTTTVTRKKEFSLGRAALSGGVVVSKETSSEARSLSLDREQVVFLIKKTGEAPVLLSETRLKFGGLGERIGRTATANVGTLFTMLAERTPSALHDERMLTSPRKSASLSLSRGTGTSVTTASNASETELSAHLLAVAHLRGEL